MNFHIITLTVGVRLNWKKKNENAELHIENQNEFCFW